MVGSGAVALKGQELVPPVLSPEDNILHRVHTVIMNIVLKHNADPVIFKALNDILPNLLCRAGASRVVTVHVPVKVPEARVLYRLGQGAHNPL